MIGTDRLDKENMESGTSALDKSGLGLHKFNLLDNTELSRTPTKVKTPLEENLIIN